MAKPRVFVTRVVAQEALDKIAQDADMEIWPEELPPPYEVLLEKVRDAEGVLTTLNDKIDTALMDAAPKLKVVSNFAVGYDNISVAEATKRHIVVSNTPEVLTGTTADPLLTLDNIIITPHIASASFTTRKNMAFEVAENLLAGLRGQTPPNCVNPEALRN